MAMQTVLDKGAVVVNLALKGNREVVTLKPDGDWAEMEMTAKGLQLGETVRIKVEREVRQDG